MHVSKSCFNCNYTEFRLVSDFGGMTFTVLKRKHLKIQLIAKRSESKLRPSEVILTPL